MTTVYILIALVVFVIVLVLITGKERFKSLKFRILSVVEFDYQTYETKNISSNMKNEDNKSINIQGVDGDVVVSENQSGGITAHTVNVDTKKRKIFGDLAKEDLLRELPKHVSKERPIKLMMTQGYDQHMVNTYNEIKKFLIENNFPLLEGFHTFMADSPVLGLKINLTNPNQVALMIGPDED